MRTIFEAVLVASFSAASCGEETARDDPWSDEGVSNERSSCATPAGRLNGELFSRIGGGAVSEEGSRVTTDEAARDARRGRGAGVGAFVSCGACFRKAIGIRRRSHDVG